MKLKKNVLQPRYMILTGAIAVVVIGGGVWMATRNDDTTGTANNSNVSETDEDTSDYIVVEAGDGILDPNASKMSYIGESARGLEAYLANDGDHATYTVDIAKPGTYKLDVKLSDDGVWQDGDRNVTVTINKLGQLRYYHRSEDTKGWKWYTLGTVTMKAGANEFVFTKDPGGYAAYTMDEFRLRPEQVTTE